MSLKIILEFGGWGDYRKVKSIMELDESVGATYLRKRRKISSFLVMSS